MSRPRIASALALALLFLSVQGASAQSEVTPEATPTPTPASGTPRPAAAPTTSAAPSEPTATPAPAQAEPAATAAPVGASPPAAPPARARCILGTHAGIKRADARTSAVLVCQALRDRGVAVDTRPSRDDGTAQGSAYRVELMRLGYTLVLRVDHESPLGSSRDSRSLRLSGIEEVATAAPRIADSMVDGSPLEDSAKVDNLVGQETQSYSKKYGETLFGVGIFGFAIPNSDVLAGYGAFGRFYYETPAYAVGAELRVGGSGDGQGDASLVGLSVGARYFLNEADISPFVGGGLGILWLGMDSDMADEQDEAGYYDYGSDMSGSGLGAYGEIGIEFLRLHGSRLDVLARVEAPFYTLRVDDHATGEKYALPISIMASYSFE